MADTIRLSELQISIKQTLNRHLPSSVWIVAEISEIKSNYSGHCYLTLVEQDESSKKLLAQARATIWASRFRMINSHFQEVTEQALKSGIQVLVCVEVNFHEIYGMSLNVLDIDPTYTMGDIARQRQEIINRLTKEGIFEMNKEFALPPVIQNIAIVSSETAAGFQDFMKQLENNPEKIKFKTKLYPALVQGNTAPSSLINALENIKAYEQDYDAVVLIRGGGAQTDLACFDDYELSKVVALYPYPIITGIGHDKDVSIVDMVANTTLKTPTAVAEFIVSRANDFNTLIINTFQVITTQCNTYLKSQQQQVSFLGLNIGILTNKSLNNRQIQVNKFISSISNSSLNLLSKEKNTLRNKLHSFAQQAKFALKEEMSKIKHLAEKTDSLNPENIMKQGYCYTKVNGKTVSSVRDVNNGDVLSVKFINGEVKSKVEKVISDELSMVND